MCIYIYIYLYLLIYFYWSDQKMHCDKRYPCFISERNLKFGKHIDMKYLSKVLVVFSTSTCQKVLKYRY